MTQKTFDLLESHMLACMGDSAHDAEHVRRVLYLALEIAESEPSADRDVLIAACLLHDIGREEQFRDPSLCHAQVGAEKAYRFLLDHDFSEDFAAHVRDCIRTHRFRSGDPPATIEARILFDADKLDVTGASRHGADLLLRRPGGTASVYPSAGRHGLRRHGGGTQGLPLRPAGVQVQAGKIYDRFLTRGRGDGPPEAGRNGQYLRKHSGGGPGAL